MTFGLLRLGLPTSHMRAYVNKPITYRFFIVTRVSLQPNTFQLVIAFDPSRYQTFTQYVYMDMGWDHEYTARRSMIGHLSYKQEQEESLALAASMTWMAFTLNTRDGNTGEWFLLHCIQLTLFYLGQAKQMSFVRSSLHNIASNCFVVDLETQSLLRTMQTMMVL